VLRYVEAADYRGYDPYDALNSPVVRVVCGPSKWARIAATQLVRRCPLNLRPLLGIHKGHNPKGLGLFLWVYAKLYAMEREPRYLERIERLLDLLHDLRSTGYSGNCWGYNFDWQSRTCLRPRGTPTVVNTAFIGHALLDCFEFTGNERALEMATPITEFVLRDLRRTRGDEGFCFSYTPVDNEIVHNANLLGASILARLTEYRADDRLAEAASASVAYSMNRQREDGSWYYANTSAQKWIDSFHTGFILQALRYCLWSGVALEQERAYQRGVRYYADHFFLENGMPKYYHDRLYPIDIHSPAQAVAFFSREGERYRDLADAIVTWMLDNMYGGEGFFYYRQGRWRTNRIPYMRWSQAWALHALTEYLCSQSERNPYGGHGTACRTDGAGRADKLL